MNEVRAALARYDRLEASARALYESDRWEKPLGAGYFAWDELTMGDQEHFRGQSSAVLKAADSVTSYVLVEDSWIPASELPATLGNFMRLSDRYAQEAKSAYLRAEAAGRERDAAKSEVVRGLTEASLHLSRHAGCALDEAVRMVAAMLASDIESLAREAATPSEPRRES